MKEKIKNFLDKCLNVLRKKWLTNTVTIVVLVVIILALYLLVAYLMNNVTFSDIDLTGSKIYSLSDESISKIENIDKEVKFTFVNYDESGYVVDFAKKYGKENKNIKVEVVDDLSSRVDLIQEFGLVDGQDLIIVESDGRTKTLSSSDLYTYDYNTYEQIDKTEEAFTNAILNVTVSKKPKIYFMIGHNYYSMDYFNTITSAIKAEANEVNAIDLFLTGAIPEDCDTLVITSLKNDITEMERDILLTYINNGGKILMLLDPEVVTGVLTPNFDSVLNQFGVSVSNGIIVEQNSNNMVAGSPEFIISDVLYNSITSKLNMEMRMCAIYAGRLEFNENKLEEMRVSYEPIATTSSEAFLRTDFTSASYRKNKNDIDAGDSIVAALINKKINNEKEAKLIIYSNAILATDTVVSMGLYQVTPVNLYNNKDMILNSISYLNNREDIITIRKNYDMVSYTVTTQQNRIIGFILIFIPILIIFIGIVVFRVRRRKR